MNTTPKHPTIKKIIKTTIIAAIIIIATIGFLALLRHTFCSKPDIQWEEFITARGILESYKDEYYYTHLSESEQIVYEQILHKFVDSQYFEDNFHLLSIIPNSTLIIHKDNNIQSPDDLFNVIYAVQCDLPELIWNYDKGQMVYTIGNYFLITFKFNSHLDTKEEVYLAYEQIDQYMAENIEPLITTEKTPEEIEQDIYTVITSTMIRDEEREGCAFQSVYGLVSDQRVVCTGTSKTLKYIDKKYNLGLEVVNAVGDLETSTGEKGAHMWSTVKLYNKIKIVDIVNYKNGITNKNVLGLKYTYEGKIGTERQI